MTRNLIHNDSIMLQRKMRLFKLFLIGDGEECFFPHPSGCRIAAECRLRRQTGKKMRIVDKRNKIGLHELQRMAEASFGDLVKAVVDIRQSVMAVDAELHADEEALLIESGSNQTDLWGINLYPELEGMDFIEYDSMINLRPSAGNRSRGVEDPAIREKIQAIVADLVMQ